MSFDWKRMLRSVAPTLATAVGGPFAGMATKAISDAVLGKPDGDEDEISAALAGGDPAVLLKVKEAENAFKVQMKELGLKEEQLHAEDRDSARKREAATGDSATPRVLAFLIIAGFFGVVAFVLVKGLGGLDKDTAMLVGTLVGYVSAKAEQVVAYYFGSSAGSKNKDQIIKALR